MTAKELVGGTETSVSNSFALPYSSGFTASVFNGVVEGNNSSIGLTVNALTGTSYSNNVTNVPVGGFGLYGYTITNSSASNIYALTLPAASSLPSGMTYDSTRATCKITNKQMLKSSESCTMVFKYQPTIKGVSGVFNFKFIAVDEFMLRDFNLFVDCRFVFFLPYTSISRC
jgi:hypothetical protein